MKITFSQCKKPEVTPEKTSEEKEENKNTLLSALIEVVGCAIFISSFFFEKRSLSRIFTVIGGVLIVVVAIVSCLLSKKNRINLFAKLCRCFPKRFQKILLSDTSYFGEGLWFIVIWTNIISIMEHKNWFPLLFTCSAEVSFLVIGVLAVREGYLNTKEKTKDVEIV